MDIERFAGTCYRAALDFLGYIVGRGKDDHTQKKTDPSKPCTAVPLSVTSGRNSAMDQLEAENIHDFGKKPIVTGLLTQDVQINNENKYYLALSVR